MNLFARLYRKVVALKSSFPIETQNRSNRRRHLRAFSIALTPFVVVLSASGSNALKADALRVDVTSEQPSSASAGFRGGALDDIDRQNVVAQYGRLPLYFEKNEGQTVPEVQYLARGIGYSFFLTRDEAVICLEKRAAAVTHGKDPHIENTPIASKVSGAVIRAQLVGANPNVVVEGNDPTDGSSNYFKGKNSATWRTGIPNYAQVRYRNIYHGIDLIYYGNQHQLEYDFVVAPGIDPRSIKLHYSGVDSTSIDAQGSLHLRSGDQDVIEHQPEIYQLQAGKRQPVFGKFALAQTAAGAEVAFAIGDYDRKKPLVIDPALVYSTFLNGYDGHGSADAAIAVDGSGYAYVTGSTQSLSYPTTSGAFQGSYGGVEDAFVSKINLNGSNVVYSTYLGGSNSDLAFAIAVDSDGYAYITGTTQSTDFPTTTGAFQVSKHDNTAAFVTKVSANGKSLIYSTYLGGTGTVTGTTGYGIAVDGSTYAYVVGETSNAAFPVTSGAFQTTLRGHENGFVTKLATDGGSLVYSTYLGGTAYDQANGVAVSTSGAAFVVGTAGSYDFPVTSNAYQATLAGDADAFVSKLNASGSALAYSTYIGGSGQDLGNAIAQNDTGYVWITGSTGSSDFPVTSTAFQTTFNGLWYNAFVTKLSTVGTSGISFSTYLGGSGTASEGGDTGLAIALDSNSVAYITGSTASTDFPTTLGAYQTTMSSSETTDAFFTKLNSNGSALSYSTFLGGTITGRSVGYGLALDSQGAVYLAGSTNSSDFPIIYPPAFQHILLDNAGFISKIVPISATPENLSFGNQTVGTTSTAKVVTLKNRMQGALSITSIATGTSAFGQTNTCGSSVAAGANCTISVTFSPATTGLVTDTLTVTTAAATMTVSLQGTGI